MAVQISGNDITVPRDTTVTRNLTVGGVLTYEDVTNVDSVGLVTARSGIEIGARPGVAASISVDGNMIVSGISTFGGDVQVPDKIIHSGDTNTAIRFPAADTVTVETGGSERFRIDSTGNTLIYGAIRKDNISSSLAISGGNAADSSANIVLHGSSGSPSNVTQFRTGSTERLRIDSSGRLLLGHTAVGSKGAASPLQVQTADSGAFAVTIRNRSSNNDYGFIGFTDDDADEDLVQIGIQRTAANNGDLFFYTNGGASSSSERLRIKSDGKVGINDTNPLATLHIEGHNTTNGTVFLEPHSSKGNNISHIHHGSAGNWYIRPADASGYIYHDIGKSQFTNGILFGSDTADANALDDYEEGTWTPVPGVGTVTLGNGGAKYTKIGRVVYCQFDINYSGSSSNSSGFSLPFNSASNYGSGSVGWTNKGYPLFVHVQSTAFAIMDNSSTNGSSSQHATYSEISGTRLIGDFRYFIA